MSFRYCPNCGSQTDGKNARQKGPKFHCPACDYIFYFNSATTASLILICGDELLFSRRGRQPSKGLYDFPGGFVDAGESVEEALVREMHEEINWCPEQFQYAFSCPNIYNYRNVTYQTSDIFYIAEVLEKPDLTAQDDVASLSWMKLSDLADEQLAFHSVKLVVDQLKQRFR